MPTPTRQILLGDCRETLPKVESESKQCVVTSPPYWGLRRYGESGNEIGQEKTPEEYVKSIVGVFREIHRILKPDGTLWLNLGDSYARDPGKGVKFEGGHNRQCDNRQAKEGNIGMEIPSGLKPKDLVGIPWMVAFALRSDGWYLRQDIIWAKPNGMPESVEDRCTRSHEYVFLLSKSERYFFDYKAIETQAKESSLARWDQNIEMQVGTERANGGAKTNGPLRAAGGPHKKDKQRGHSRRHAGFNERWDAMTKEEQCQTARRRDVWWISPACFSDAHFAVMPAELARLCVLAGSKSGDTILDPFSGSGTTGEVALELGRNFIGCELYEKFLPMIERRTSQPGLMLA